MPQTNSNVVRVGWIENFNSNMRNNGETGIQYVNCEVKPHQLDSRRTDN